MKIKKRCEKCKKMYNKLIQFKGKLLCKKCFLSNSHIIPKRLISLEEAQKKERNVYLSILKNKYLRGQINVPSCYVGKKVKVVVV